jgi:hypothetical protein
MRLIGVRLTVLAIGVIAVVSSTSCNDHSAGSKQAAANTKPGPEESFETIMEVFRRRMEETPIGFVVSDASSRSTLTGMNKVSHELIKPANPGEPYKAVVTVTSQSRYWVARTKESDEADREREAKEAAAKEDNLAAESGDENAKSFDPSVSGAGDISRSRAGSLTGDRTAIPSSDKDERKYELDYENGRWKLVTALDPDTEQSVQNAFRNALDTQE